MGEAGSSVPRPIGEFQAIKTTSYTVTDDSEVVGQAHATNTVDLHQNFIRNSSNGRLMLYR